MDRILLRGARQNNLRDVTLEIPHGSLTVVTGVSGSGKSSLAVDTLYAEGQRRFVESLSSYARQFLERLPRPEVERVEGIPPAVLLERRTPAATYRSTVATAAELYDHLRLLFARASRAHCLRCGGAMRRDTVDSLLERVRERGGEGWVEVLFPVRIPAGAAGRRALAELLARGFHRLRAGERTLRLEPEMPWKAARDPAWVVVDRVALAPGAERRLAESLETALREGEGRAALAGAGGEPEAVRLELACERCGAPGADPQPQLFSFNSAHGACPECRGFGDVLEPDTRRIVPDEGRTLAEGAVDPWRGKGHRFYHRRLLAFCEREGVETGVPWRSLPAEHRRWILEGRGAFRGLLPFLARLQRKRYRPHVRFFLRRYYAYRRCAACDGSRLRPEALAFRLGGFTIGEVLRRTVAEAAELVERIELDAAQEAVAGRVRRELAERLRLLADLGLGYLTLDRLSRTLSGGEYQRLGLGASLGAGLTGVLYVMDEPTVGLHGRDTERLIGVLNRLRDRGNTLLVVEHDRQVIEAADHAIELGPGAGHLGGRLLHAGPGRTFASADTLTGRWLRGERRVEPAASRRAARDWLRIRGAREHNLKNLEVAVPLGVLVAVTGVSGSGKTTLTRDILFRALEDPRERKEDPGEHDALEGRDRAGEPLLVDQSPIGSSARSNPASYVGALAPIREAFAASADAVRRGLKPGFFSFNVAGGRCESCEGEGSRRVDMQFLADVFVECEGCQGTRFRREALEVRVRGKNIHEVLQLTVQEALVHFHAFPPVLRRLEPLARVGLGYLRLGQPAPTLSGGEAQRLKIARELDLQRASPAFYLLDEPTTGLHLEDVRVLLQVLNELVDRGDTVMVVEHHPDVIARCDWVIDLGPEGGESGGELVGEGTPEALAAHPGSHTGRMLRETLGRPRRPGPGRRRAPALASQRS